MKTVLIDDGDTLQIEYSGDEVNNVKNDFGHTIQEKVNVLIASLPPDPDRIVTITTEIEI